MRVFVFLLGVLLTLCACQNEPKPKVKDPVLVEYFGLGYDTILREPIYPAETLDSVAHYSLRPSNFEFNASDYQQNKGLLRLEWLALDSVEVEITAYSSLCNCVSLDYKKEIQELNQPNLINITFDSRKWKKGEHKYLFIYTSGFPYEHKIKLKRNL